MEIVKLLSLTWLYIKLVILKYILFTRRSNTKKGTPNESVIVSIIGDGHYDVCKMAMYWKNIFFLNAFIYFYLYQR